MAINKVDVRIIFSGGKTEFITLFDNKIPIITQLKTKFPDYIFLFDGCPINRYTKFNKLKGNILFDAFPAIQPKPHTDLVNHCIECGFDVSNSRCLTPDILMWGSDMNFN